MLKRLVQLVEIFITIILNFNAFTINLQKQFIECLGKTQGTGKITPSLVQPTIYSPPGTLAACVPQPLSCGFENSFYL